jgi:antitoxin (DNA-binding transcriptional repressor) of toxin-antitoxin stability system
MPKTITATKLARNLSRVVDTLSVEGGEVVIERNGRQVARLLPAPARQTALEAMADLYRTLADEAAATWEADSRRASRKGAKVHGGVRNPWHS